MCIAPFCRFQNLSVIGMSFSKLKICFPDAIVIANCELYSNFKMNYQIIHKFCPNWREWSALVFFLHKTLEILNCRPRCIKMRLSSRSMYILVHQCNNDVCSQLLLWSRDSVTLLRSNKNFLEKYIKVLYHKKNHALIFNRPNHQVN